MTASRASRWAAAVGVLALGAGVPALRLPPWPAGAQAMAQGPARFLADGREGTRRYQSQQEAIDDGFKRVGTEFPAMGEHWVSFGRVMDDTLDARRPSVLIYVNTGEGPRLAGVAYSRLIEGGSPPPAFPFAGAWHEHNGAVAEESLPFNHESHASGADPKNATTPADSLRFFILHAWIWTANPDGPFATDNWALPLFRLGLEPGTPVGRDVIRALALGSDGSDYHHTVMSAALRLRGPDDSVVAGVVREHRARIDDAMRAIRETRRVTPPQAALLGATWGSLWSELQRALPAHSLALERLRARM